MDETAVSYACWTLKFQVRNPKWGLKDFWEKVAYKAGVCSLDKSFQSECVLGRWGDAVVGLEENG